MLCSSGLPIPALPALGPPCLLMVCLPRWTVSWGGAKAVSVTTVSQVQSGCSGNVIALGWIQGWGRKYGQDPSRMPLWSPA